MAKTELPEGGPWQEIILLNGWEWRGRTGTLLHKESCVSPTTQNGVSTTRQGENTKLGVWRLLFPPVLLKLVIILCSKVQDSESHNADDS